jgi:hypothetical protein
MAQDEKRSDDFNSTAKMAMQQAQGAAQQYFGWVQKTMSASPWGASDLNKKLMGFAEQNMATTFAYVQKLSEVRNFQDLMRIQTEYVQGQLETFGRQARDLIEASAKATHEAASKPKNPSS